MPHPIPPTDTHNRPTRALLRYFGGKWAIAPWVLSHFPPHRLYVEPFGDAKHRTATHCKAREWANYPRTLATISRRLQGVILECRPAQQVIRAQDTPDTLFFVDPPCLPTTRSKSGYRHEMTEPEHIALLAQLREVKGMVVLAGYPSDLYDQTLHDWHRIDRPHHAAGSTRPRTEVLWLSPATVANRMHIEAEKT